MRKFYKMTMLLVTFFTLIGTAKAQMPVAGKWYTVKAKDTWKWNVGKKGTTNNVVKLTAKPTAIEQLFKVEENGGVYTIYSVLNEGSAIGATGDGNNTVVTIGGTPVNQFTFTASTATAGATLISPNGTTRNLNSYNWGHNAGNEQGNEYLSFYQDGDNDEGNRWKFEEVTNYREVLEQTVTNYSDWLNNLPAVDFGQPTTAIRTTFSTALTNAEAANYSDNSDAQWLTDAKGLSQAKSVVETTIDTDVNTLLGDGTKDRWYTIATPTCGTNPYSGKAITAEGTTKFKAADKTGSDEQLFRFVVVSGKVKIINKANEKAIGANGSVVDVDAAAEFAVTRINSSPNFKVKADGVDQLNIHGGNGNLVTYDDSGECGNSAFVFEFVKETEKVNTSVNDVKGANFDVVVANGKINVVGVDNFSVFTVAGQRVNANQTLQAGIYVVKAENFVQKVVVR